LRLLHLATLLLALLLVVPVLPVDAWYVRIWDLPRVQLTIVAVILTAASAAWGRGRDRIVTVATAVVALIYSFAVLSSMTVLRTATAHCDDPLQVMTLNVQNDNRAVDAVLGEVRAHDPDLLVLLETDAWWDEHLTPLDARYAHHVSAVAVPDDYYGMHVFSHEPLDADVRFLVPNDVPSVVGELSDRGVQFVALHPRPPHLGETAELRDRQLQRAASIVTATDRPAFVLGDLNAVPWERVFERFEDDAGLVDPHETLGWHASFRSAGGLLAWPLDHVLHTRHLAMSTYALGDDVGSDHLPVRAELCLTGR
jgi:endonuclease/exonuclease/phosphatase (EEP) superfamily protein YafD